MNRTDATGDTPLIKAVRLGTDHYYALIGFGTEPNVEWQVTKWPVNKRWPPQDVATVVSALHEAGADPATRDRDGKTARELASEAGLTDVAAKL